MLERRSALAEALSHSRCEGADRRRALKLGEVRGWSLVQFAAYPGTLPALAAIAERILSALPETVGQAKTSGTRLLFKTAPEQFWVVTQSETDPLAQELLSAVAPDVGTVTSLSHARIRLFIEGSAAPQVLSTALAIDMHRDSFPVDAFALSGVHHTPVLLHHVLADRYEIYALRTFAEWVWGWLTDAALPFGYQVVARRIVE